MFVVRFHGDRVNNRCSRVVIVARFILSTAVCHSTMPVNIVINNYTF